MNKYPNICQRKKYVLLLRKLASRTLYSTKPFFASNNPSSWFRPAFKCSNKKVILFLFCCFKYTCYKMQMGLSKHRVRICEKPKVVRKSSLGTNIKLEYRVFQRRPFFLYTKKYFLICIHTRTLASHFLCNKEFKACLPMNRK